MTTFPTAAVLSVTTGRLVGDLVDLVAVLEFLVDRKIQFHEIGLFVDPGGRAILVAHPEIPGADEVTKMNCRMVHEVAMGLFGEEYELTDALRGVIADDRPPNETLEAARRAAMETIRRMEDKR
jgi:hypothetical protein